MPRKKVLPPLGQPKIYEGMKVKLNYDQISSYKGWDSGEFRPDYVKWVKKHRKDVFTVELDNERKKVHEDYLLGALDDILVQFAEDTTSPKWLFWAGDLIVEPGQEKPKSDKEKELEKRIAEAMEILQRKK